eukprot:5908274-Lingulodinium_polyedra.AAC.1
MPSCQTPRTRRLGRRTLAAGKWIDCGCGAPRSSACGSTSRRGWQRHNRWRGNELATPWLD